MNAAIRQYLVITGNYWAFTLTDGALRMLVVLHFHQLGYSPLEIALLFIFRPGGIISDVRRTYKFEGLGPKAKDGSP